MAWDIEIEVANTPGTIADIGEAAAGADINLGGVCGLPCEGVGVIHVLVDDARAASEAFRSAGLEVRASREVLVVPVTDEPGALGSLTRRFADAGVNIDLIYLATDTELVLGVDDLEAGAQLT